MTYIPVDGRGLVDPDDIKRALRSETRLISIIFANNETGVIQSVREIGRIAAEADVYFHTDAVQAAGKVPLDVQEIGCDLLTITAHKMHGPHGAGALYVRKGTLLQALLLWRPARAFAPRGDGESAPALSDWARLRRLQTKVSAMARCIGCRICATVWKGSILGGVEQIACERRGCAARAEHQQHLFRLH